MFRAADLAQSKISKLPPARDVASYDAHFLTDTAKPLTELADDQRKAHLAALSEARELFRAGAKAVERGWARGAFSRRRTRRGGVLMAKSGERCVCTKSM
jgi:hypothetical protein